MNLKNLLLATATLSCFCADAQLPELTSECLWWTVNGTKPLSPYDSLVYTHSAGKNSMAMPVFKISNAATYVEGTLTAILPYGIYAYDSAQRYIYSSANTWDSSTRIIQTFNTDGSLQTVARKQYYVSPLPGWNYANKHEYTYNPDSTLAVDLFLTYDNLNSKWDTSQKFTYLYGSGKRLIFRLNQSKSSTSGIWSIGSADSFIYDANGNRIRYKDYLGGLPSASNEQYRIEYVYDVNNMLIADTLYVNSVLNYKETYQYNTNNTPASFIFYVWTGSAWDPNYRMVEYNYDSLNRLVNCKEKKWSVANSQFTQTFYGAYTYNSYNQLTSYNDGTYWRRYYYNNSSSVAHLDTDNQLKLYPVPATAFVNLELSLPAPGNINIRITDIMGRVVKQWSETAVKDYRKTISVMDMQPGNYVIQVLGNENISKQFTVIR